MKQFLFLSLIFFGFQFVKAQSNKIQYDSLLAKKLGADDYGMKSYILAILKTGTYTAKDKKESDSLFRGHMNNIGKLASEGKLTVAGPLGKNDNAYRGIFILDVKTVEEARKLCESDPAIKSNLFVVDLYPWYCSAALMEVNKIHETIQKKSH
ncbi:MAG: hypothetical protein H0U95_07605 [Bacteroidetes bacterium]|nr:hypothetical protein [Bacteroidota bacterium]